MNEYIQIAYLLSASIGVLAMIPQIKQLIATKQSDELSLGTWATWACCQVMSFVYALSIHATAYSLVIVAWFSFYATMVFLIIKYRKRRGFTTTVLYWLRRGSEENRKAPSL